MLIAICDDEIEFLKIVAGQIRRFFSRDHIDYKLRFFTNGCDFLHSDEDFDIIIMDIDLGTSNGMDIIRSYHKVHRGICILLTSHTEEMANGYKINAFRFLLKPIVEKDFDEAMAQAVKKISSSIRFIVRNGCTEVTIDADDIIYIEAGDKTSGIRTKDGFFSISKTISQMGRELSTPDFYMPHRSYIVNLNYISSISDHRINLRNGEVISISRLRYKDFQKSYYEFIRRKSQYVY